MAFLEDLEAALKHERSLTPKRVCEVLQEQYGGERVYIRKRKEPDIKPTDTVKRLIARGVKRSTAYNWVNKYQRR